jgi:hypothetical protein
MSDDPNELEAQGHEAIASGHLLLAKAARLRVSGASDTVVDKHECKRLRHVPTRTFEAAARRGDFHAMKAGRKLVAKLSDIDAWLTSRKAATEPATHDDPRADARAAYERMTRGP